MLPNSKTMDTLIKRMQNSRTISQVQDFKIMGIIIKRYQYNDTISHCSHHKHHKTFTPFHLAIAITLVTWVTSKYYRSIFWTLVNSFLKHFILQKDKKGFFCSLQNMFFLLSFFLLSFGCNLSARLSECILSILM